MYVGQNLGYIFLGREKQRKIEGNCSGYLARVLGMFRGLLDNVVRLHTKNELQNGIGRLLVLACYMPPKFP